MTLEAANSATRMAADLVQTVMGHAFDAQMNLTQKMLRFTMAANLQSPATTDVTGAGGHLDVLG